MGNWDVIIVGAGFGGLCSGALLAHAGKKVLVLEKDPVVGGRAKSILYSGQVLDDGAHIPSRAGHLESIFDDLGLPYPELAHLGKSEIYHEGKWYGPKEVFTKDMYKKVFEEMLRLSQEEMGRLDDLPLSDWVSSVSDDSGIQKLFFYLACSTSVGNRFETYSAGEMIYILREFLDRGRSLTEIGGVIKGGMNRILQPLTDYIHAHGGEVRLNTRVESVATRDGEVLGVNLEVGERLFHSQVLDVETEKADCVVVTLPLWDLFKVMDEEAFPKWWVDWVNWIGTKVSHAWSIIYGLDKPLFDTQTFRWAPNLPESGFSGIFYPMPSYGDDVNQYQFHVSYQGHYDEMPDLLNGNQAKVRRQIRDTIAMLERESIKLYPQLRDGYCWRVAHAGVYGIAQSPGFVGTKRPSMKVPGYKNLYVVSNTVQEARGISMSAIGRCARMATEAIIKTK